MVRLAHSGGQSANANAVAAHDRHTALAVPIRIGHTHRLGVLLAQLENVAHLNTTGNMNALFAAAGADTALNHLGKIVVLRTGHIPLHIHAGIVVIRLVGTGTQVVAPLQRAVV